MSMEYGETLVTSVLWECNRTQARLTQSDYEAHIQARLEFDISNEDLNLCCIVFLMMDDEIKHSTLKCSLVLSLINYYYSSCGLYT